MTVKKKQFVCLEAGCQTVIEAAGEEELVEAVQQHVAEAHNSFELEEFILAAATDVEGERPTRPPTR
jgi:predicted small metal-binding protein